MISAAAVWETPDPQPNALTAFGFLGVGSVLLAWWHGQHRQHVAQGFAPRKLGPQMKWECAVHRWHGPNVLQGVDV